MTQSESSLVKMSPVIEFLIQRTYELEDMINKNLELGKNINELREKRRKLYNELHPSGLYNVIDITTDEQS